MRDFKADETVCLSALSGAGLEELEEKLEKVLREQKIPVRHVFPYRDAAKLQMIRRYGELLKEEYLEEGIAIEAYVPIRVYEQLFAEKEQ